MIARLMEPGLQGFVYDMRHNDDIWKPLYGIYKSDKNVEYDLAMKAYGIAQLKAQGAAAAMDDAEQRYLNTFVHQIYAIATQMTREAIEDNLYSREAPQMSRAMKVSLREVTNVNAMQPLNQAFSPNKPMGDGQSLCSTQHPISNGVVSNRASTITQLNETAIEQGLIDIQYLRDQAGILLNNLAVRLIVPPQLKFTAARINGSQFTPQSANNAINPINTMNLLPKGVVDNPYLTNPGAWFIQTEAEALKYFERSPVRTDISTDPLTQNLTVVATIRHSFGPSDYNGIYGSPGA
jgi:hypothetical protein